MKSYKALKVDQFIAKLIERGYTKCFVWFKDEAGNTKNLVFENKELLVANGNKKELWKPRPETLYYLLSNLKKGKYKVIGSGEIKAKKGAGA